jgi:hypothetical protein
MNETTDHTINDFDYTADQAYNEPLLRPFEIVAMVCGVTTLGATFLVSTPLLKGMLIGGSLLGLIGALLYYGVVGTREKVRRICTAIPRTAIKAMSLPS